MIKFFRKIRQRLLSENRLGKYIVYAAGEILLVMIGIILALQVNTWQIEQENKVKERTYLKGIKDDLKKDKDLIIDLIPRKYESRMDFFHYTDSLIRIGSEEIREISTDSINKLYWPTRTFFPFVGSYASLISDNSTFYITNHELLNRIREIYDIDYQRLEYVGLMMDQTAEKIQWDRRKDSRMKYSDYTMEDYEGLYTDISRMHEIIVYYTQRLKMQMEKLDQCIEAIDKELENESGE